MEAKGVLDLMQGLGFSLRAEDGDLHVSPTEKLTHELRDLVRASKSGLVDLLSPQCFDNPRSKLRTLEKALSHTGPEPEPDFILVYHRGHQHKAHEVEEMQRRVWQAALARWRDTGEEPGVGVLHIGIERSPSGCAVCRELTEAHSTVPPPEED